MNDLQGTPAITPDGQHVVIPCAGGADRVVTWDAYRDENPHHAHLLRRALMAVNFHAHTGGFLGEESMLLSEGVPEPYESTGL